MPILDQFILFSSSFTFSVNDIITTVIMFYKQRLLSHLFKQSEYSILVIIIISACRNSSETVLLAVSLLLADKAQFVHKPAQVELQLDRPQLPYSETFGPITAGGSPAQCTLHKKGPYTHHNSFSGILHDISCQYIRHCFHCGKSHDLALNILK